MTLALDYFNGNKLAADTFLGKYALRDNDNNVLEQTPEDMHRRIARELARIEQGKFKQPLSEDEIFDYLDQFKQIIPQGSLMFGIGNPYQYVTLSNCYVITCPEDSYGGIHQTDEEITQISKRRGGVGTDLSFLRPDKSPTTNSSRMSTGIRSFAERYSYSIREVGQNNRRGALMLTLSVHHPEILNFISMKDNDDKVTGANISVRVTDEFLRAVDEDTDYQLRWPDKNPTITEMISARKVWRAIIKHARERAEPGVLFWDNILRESPADCYSGFETVCTNPCQPESASIIIKGKGLSTVGELQPGDYIWSKLEWVQVLAKWSSGIKPVYKYTVEAKRQDGSGNCYFLGTDNHRILQNGQEVEVGQATHIDCEVFPISQIFGESEYPHIFDPQFEPSPIVSTEYVGEEEVFGFTVDSPTNSYWTGGCNVKNCGELPLCIHDSCRLLVLNLFSCVVYPYTPNASFDYVKLRHLAKTAQRFMDDVIDLELEHIDRIIQKIEADPQDIEIKRRELELWKKIRVKCHDGRRTGTGITALGDAIAALGMKYGSEESITFTDKVYQTIKLGAYESSVDMAEELGPFPIWDAKLEAKNPFLLRIKSEDPSLYKKMQKYGRRNIALLTTAPTGTVSLLAKLVDEFGTSSGIEPVYQDSYIRRKKINAGDTARVDFIDQSGDKWTEYEVLHAGLTEFKRVNQGESPYKGACAEDLDWRCRVRLQGAAQRHVDHSISSTINLPESVTEEEVATIYEAAWREGLKGITVYRKNCRTGVLVDKTLTKTNAPKRPKTLPCEVYHINVSGTKYMVFVGILNGEPYEIMAYEGSYEGTKQGTITKMKRGTYKADLGTIVIDSITDRCTPEEEAITRLVSTSLRHGADIQFIVHQLEKTGGSMTSFAKCLARTLKKYIEDGARVSGDECPTCQGNLVRQEGCIKCVNCNFSKCG